MMSKSRILENDPDGKEKVAATCEGCGEGFEYYPMPVSPRRFCSLTCSMKADPSPPLSSSCLLCGNPKDLSTHHIDYDLTNVSGRNCVSLCCGCRSKVDGGDRYFWRTLFSICLSGSKLVVKTWGLEVHIANHADYCLKYLVFFEGQYFSNHYHVAKKEAWHCLVGGFEVALTDEDENLDVFLLYEGDKLELERKLVHQIRALKNSIITEVSTQSFAEDSYKDYPSLL
jgi:mannose-6-phosphate isomerase-like protein (cupin superfamily)